jgi:hypothetical protein
MNHPGSDPLIRPIGIGGGSIPNSYQELVMPAQVGMFAGFWYMTLSVTMPLMATRYEKKAEALK